MSSFSSYDQTTWDQTQYCLSKVNNEGIEKYCLAKKRFQQLQPVKLPTSGNDPTITKASRFAAYIKTVKPRQVVVETGAAPIYVTHVESRLQYRTLNYNGRLVLLPDGSILP